MYYYDTRAARAINRERRQSITGQRPDTRRPTQRPGNRQRRRRTKTGPG